MSKYSLFSSLIAVSIFFFSLPLVPTKATSDVVKKVEVSEESYVDISEEGDGGEVVPVVAVLTPDLESCPPGFSSCNSQGATRPLRGRPLQRIKRLFRR
jgi:hypothetical protein